MRYFTDKNRLKAGLHENTSFEFFQIQKSTLQAVRAEKIDENNGVICLVSKFPSWFMFL